MQVSGATASLRFGRYTAVIGPEEIAWTRHKLASEILAAGDIVYVKVLASGPAGGPARVSLEQDSGAQGALLALDNSSGDIRAMVGGRDFNLSKFNRATQALRQTGSSFKPYVYTAAIDNGATPDDMILDGPVTFQTASGPYTPHNYERKFEGNVTLRHALAESLNIPALKLAEHVSIHKVIEYARRFGITSNLPPYLPLAIGAGEVTLFEHTSAFTTFPNDGVRVVPRYIRKVTNYEGRTLEEDFPEVRDVVPARTARTMVSMLREVVLHGTGFQASKLKHPLAGKTGTTNDFSDAWFLGFSPSITCGVWVGFDEKTRTLGSKETGAQAALPIWIDLMKVAIKDVPDEQFPEDAEAKPQPPPAQSQAAPGKPPAPQAQPPASAPKPQASPAKPSPPPSKPDHPAVAPANGKKR
jgi:penicillin-binding protein 1A